MIDSEKIKKALDAMDNADLQKEYNPIASQKTYGNDVENSKTISIQKIQGVAKRKCQIEVY